MRNQRTPLSAEKALEMMENLCARAEYSSGEIRDRLYRKGLPQSQITQIVERLCRNRFIDDARFARAFVHEKVTYSGWGRAKIVASLIQKRLDRDIINQALEEIDQEVYQANLKRILDAKLRTFDDPDAYESRAKAFRHAAGRGYEPDLISKFL